MKITRHQWNQGGQGTRNPARMPWVPPRGGTLKGQNWLSTQGYSDHFLPKKARKNKNKAYICISNSQLFNLKRRFGNIQCYQDDPSPSTTIILQWLTLNLSQKTQTPILLYFPRVKGYDSMIIQGENLILGGHTGHTHTHIHTLTQNHIHTHKDTYTHAHTL